MSGEMSEADFLDCLTKGENLTRDTIGDEWQLSVNEGFDLLIESIAGK